MLEIGPLELLLVIAAALPSLAALGFWIWTLVDVLQVRSDSDYRAGSKLIWVLVLLFGSCLGSIIYLAVGRPRKSEER